MSGQLIDRFSALRLLPFFLIPLAVASAAIGLITPGWGIYLFMFLLGISSGFTHTLLGAVMARQPANVTSSAKLWRAKRYPPYQRPSHR